MIPGVRSGWVGRECLEQVVAQPAEVVVELLGAGGEAAAGFGGGEAEHERREQSFDAGDQGFVDAGVTQDLVDGVADP